MKNLFRLALLVLCLLARIGLAQGVPPSGEPDAPPPGNPRFSQQELDQMLAPVALYPDALLSQILMAATYPLEVVEAARWSAAHPQALGSDASQAVAGERWDPSVKSLIAVPQVLQVLDSRIDWTERLGDAFLGQRPEVMDTIQQLRARARAAGNLNTTAQMTVADSDDGIEVSETDPRVVYVPYYDPGLVYGAWWWADYPPVFWSPWAGYGWAGPFAWGVGIGVGVDLFFGSWNWRHHDVYGRAGHGGPGAGWQFDPGHRHGVPFRDPGLSRQLGRGPAVPAARAEFRGQVDRGQVDRGPGAAARSLSPLHGQGGPGAAPGFAHEPGRAGTGVSPAAPPAMRGSPGRGSTGAGAFESRGHALENVGRGAEVRGFSARGQAAVSARPSAGGGQRSGHEQHR